MRPEPFSAYTTPEFWEWPGGNRVFWNWMPRLTTDEAAGELERAGLTVEGSYGDVAGAPFDAQSRTSAVRVRRQADRAWLGPVLGITRPSTGRAARSSQAPGSGSGRSSLVPRRHPAQEVGGRHSFLAGTRLRRRINQSTPPKRAPMRSPKAKIAPIVVNTCA